MQRKEHLDPLAIGLLLTCCAFWGFQQVLVKATLPEMAPIFMAGVRFTGAACGCDARTTPSSPTVAPEE